MAKDKNLTENETPVKKPVEDITYECPYAPMGKSSTIIEMIEGTGNKAIKSSYKIEMINKKYVILADTKDKENLILCLKKNGFRDVTNTPKTGIKYVKQSNSWIYYSMHPMHTDRHPINGNLALVLKDESGRAMVDENGKQITKQLTVSNGMVETTNKDIYQALMKTGFLPAGKEVTK